MVEIKNLKKNGDIVSFDGYGDKTFTCSFNVNTGETTATTDNKFILAMAKYKILATLASTGVLPTEMMAMSH